MPHGGLTGLVGGGNASETKLVLALERMNRIEDINAADRRPPRSRDCTLPWIWGKGHGRERVVLDQPMARRRSAIEHPSDCS